MYHRTLQLFSHIQAAYASYSTKPLVIITGDLVTLGNDTLHWRNVKKALDYLNSFGFTVLTCPGNHDYNRGHGPRPEDYTEYREYVGGPAGSSYPTELRIGDHLFLGLNSLYGVHKGGKVFLAQGWLHDEQIDKMKNLISEYRATTPNGRIIVYLHHHPAYPPGAKAVGSHLLKDGVNLVVALVDNPVDVLLFGHDHDQRRVSFLEGDPPMPVLSVANCAGRCTQVGQTPQWQEIDTQSAKATMSTVIGGTVFPAPTPAEEPGKGYRPYAMQHL